MANVNKRQSVMRSAGLPSKEQILSSPSNTDTLPAQVNGANGAAPAMLTEGEFVFSLPAIIALGEGDYDKGLQMLEGVHNQLKEVGDQMVGEIQKDAPQEVPDSRGLAAAQMQQQ